MSFCSKLLITFPFFALILELVMGLDHLSEKSPKLILIRHNPKLFLELGSVCFLSEYKKSKYLVFSI